MKVVVYSLNFDETGYDRGQSIEHLVDYAYVRQSPCFFVFSNFTVDFNGKVMPCCNLRRDHHEHQPFILGDLSDRGMSISEVYANRFSAQWRRSLARVSAKQAPCSTCKQKVVQGQALVRLGKAIDVKLSTHGLDV